MDFIFPELSNLSLWDLACCLTGQNATDEKPTNETRHKLAELTKAVYSKKLWVEWPPGTDFDFLTGFIPSALNKKVRTDWHSLDDVTVRREDWQRYREHINAALNIAAPARTETFNESELTAMDVIEVEAGRTHLLAWDLVNRIAEVLAPTRTSERETILAGLDKRYRIGEGQFRDEKLTPDDWNLLNAIWSDMPPVKDSTLEQFQEYRRAFESMVNRPEWMLQANFKNLRDEAATIKANIRSDHAELIDEAIKNGALVALTETRTKADKLWLGVTVSIEEARNYLRPLRFELKVAEHGGESAQREVVCPEGTLGWWDYTMDAAFWWKQPTVSPREAALLLCQLNPHHDDLTPEGHDNGLTGPQDYKKLLRAFEGLQSVQQEHRNLEQWVCVAQREGLKYHSWIDDYLLALDMLAASKKTEVESLVPVPAGDDSLSSFALASSAVQAQAEEWIVKSISLANEIGGQRWARKEYGITARNICDAVATELAKGEPGESQKYHGSQGPRSAGNIRNIALKGWKFVHPTGTSGTNGMDEKIA